MKKRYYSYSLSYQWNKLVKKFIKTRKKLEELPKEDSSSNYRFRLLLNKLHNLYKKLKRLEKRVGIKLAGSAIALMMITASASAQDFVNKGFITYSGARMFVTYHDVVPTAVDLNNDGKKDLILSQLIKDPQIYINKGNGKFEYAGRLKADGEPIEASEVRFGNADLDGDGDIDLFLVEKNSTIVEFKNDGNGNFSKTDTLEDLDGNPLQITATTSIIYFGDFNNDGRPDLIEGLIGGGLKVYNNAGGIQFSPGQDIQDIDGLNISVGISPSPVLYDFEDDNDNDLYISSSENKIYLFKRSETEFAAYDTLTYGNGSDKINNISRFDFLDFNDDGYLDIFGNSTFLPPSLYQYDPTIDNYKASIFPNFYGGENFGVQPLSIDFGDLDNDGVKEMYVGNGDSFTMVYKNDGKGNFSVLDTLKDKNGNDILIQGASLAFADLDGDGNVDLYIGDSNGVIYVYKNEGNGSLVADGKLQAGGIDLSVAMYASPSFADIDGDGDLDLVVGEYYGYLSVFENDGNGNFTYKEKMQADGQTINFNGDYYTHPAFADFDKDGDMDLYLAAGDSYIHIYLNDGTGVFSGSDTMKVDGANLEYRSPDLAFVDVDNDGDTDMYIADQYGSIYFFENTEIVVQTNIEQTYQKVSVYPNPAKDFIFIEGGQFKSAQIFSVSGKKVKTITKINDNKIGIDKLPQGVYILKLNGTEKNTTIKFIKQ